MLDLERVDTISDENARGRAEPVAEAGAQAAGEEAAGLIMPAAASLA
jgi:hypothetical protein